MGLMDTIKGMLGGSKSGGGDLMAALTGLLSGTGPIGSKLGGLSGILERFNLAGMGDKVQSWLGQGENEPLTGDEVEKALGTDTIDEVATATGGQPAQVKSGLAGMLPGLVDKLTPDGKIPGTDQIGGLLGKLDLSKFLGGFGK
jgi:uncharacterized protein YidB (DUF937 family)